MDVKLHKESLDSIGRIAIACFFVWHVCVFFIGGVGNTLSTPLAVKMRIALYPKVYAYLDLIDQRAQNWGFFSFVPNAIVRFTFYVGKPDGSVEVFEEYSLTDWPYVGRQTKFNLLREFTRDKGRNSSQIARYMQYYCTKNNLKDVNVTLHKKYAYLPEEHTMNNFNWSAWEPYWQAYPITTVRCQP